VTGAVALENLKQNNTAEAGCKLYLTKPLGIGVLSTAQKQKVLLEEHRHIARDLMCQLNDFGEKVASMDGITALTDVTGFGLLGHLSEICEGSAVNAVVIFDKVPIIAEARDYLQQGAIPGGTLRNFDSYGHKVGHLSDEQKHILCDPQTSGGLLIAVQPEREEQLLSLAKDEGFSLSSFGHLTPVRGDVRIDVI